MHTPTLHLHRQHRTTSTTRNPTTEQELVMTDQDERPDDVCTCGDYRRQHDGHDPKKRCILCRNSTAPYDNCSGFRLYRRGVSP